MLNRYKIKEGCPRRSRRSRIRWLTTSRTSASSRTSGKSLSHWTSNIGSWSRKKSQRKCSRQPSKWLRMCKGMTWRFRRQLSVRCSLTKRLSSYTSSWGIRSARCCGLIKTRFCMWICFATGWFRTSLGLASRQTRRRTTRRLTGGSSSIRRCSRRLSAIR